MFTLKNIQKIFLSWDKIIGKSKKYETKKEDLFDRIKDCLPSNFDEATVIKNTIKLGYSYIGFNKQSKIDFFELLINKFDIDNDKLNELLKSNQKEDLSQLEKLKLNSKLQEILVPKRMIILKNFLNLPQGMKFLVEMREEVLSLKKEYPILEIIANDLKIIFKNWFDVGLLDLQDITWESSANLLEKLIEYEAVHEIKSWDDLKNRLDSDRKCFALFHYKMQNDPLIFVEVAFAKGIARNIQVLLDETAPVITSDNIDTAVFYSISNTQKGLNGISFGNFLIKRVVEQLTKEYKQLKQFVTLSPIPGFRKWLTQELNDFYNSKIIKRLDLENLEQYLGKDKTIQECFIEILSKNEWVNDHELCEKLKPIMLKLCEIYLTEIKNKKNQALDPVANFHLSNGSAIKYINWKADLSNKGMSQSFGMMVNYIYILSDIDNNHFNYKNNKKIKSFLK